MSFRFGLIGAGGVAETHILAMRMAHDVQVTAIADVDLARAKTLAERYGIPGVFDSAEALLAGASVDAVAILTPHHLHLPAVRAAARTAGRCRWWGVRMATASTDAPARSASALSKTPGMPYRSASVFARARSTSAMAVT